MLKLQGRIEGRRPGRFQGLVRGGAPSIQTGKHQWVAGLTTAGVRYRPGSTHGNPNRRG